MKKVFLVIAIIFIASSLFADTLSETTESKSVNKKVIYKSMKYNQELKVAVCQISIEETIDGVTTIKNEQIVWRDTDYTTLVSDTVNKSVLISNVTAKLVEMGIIEE